VREAIAQCKVMAADVLKVSTDQLVEVRGGIRFGDTA